MATIDPTEEKSYVLIVEDDDGAREALSDCLELEGFKVASARNGKEALDYLHRSPPPKVILLDLFMPVMTGWEFRDAQKKDAAIANIPVVVVTAFGAAVTQKIDVDLVMHKPLDLDRLVSVIRQYE
ncbi:MAG TPA: response regulator [Candidatus Binataceae bacterium]|nr:response regulator [Candidatus Binataceae bacterium]